MRSIIGLGTLAAVLAVVVGPGAVGAQRTTA
jgi:hypothetical protein